MLTMEVLLTREAQGTTGRRQIHHCKHLEMETASVSAIYVHQGLITGEYTAFMYDVVDGDASKQGRAARRQR